METYIKIVILLFIALIVLPFGSDLIGGLNTTILFVTVCIMLTKEHYPLIREILMLQIYIVQHVIRNIIK